MPDNYVNCQSRAFFDIGVQLLHSVFGVATNQQIEALKSTAIHSATNNAKAFATWQKHANRLSSFIAVSNTHFDNLAHIVTSQQSMVTQLHAATLEITTNLSALKTLLAYAIVNITNFITVLIKADDIRLEIKGLVHGRLSPVILPPDAIKHTLIEIHKTLPYSLTSLYLEKLPADYY